jgi:hypothetical protein
LGDSARCEAALLMDNYSPHMDDAVIAILTGKRARVIIFTLHATHIFQVLDVVLFDTLEKHGTGLRTLEKQQSAIAFLIKVHHHFKQTIVEVNIWGAFAAIAFIHDIEQNPYDNSNILSFLYMLLPQEIRQYLWLLQYMIPSFIKTRYFNPSEIDISFFVNMQNILDFSIFKLAWIFINFEMKSWIRWRMNALIQDSFKRIASVNVSELENRKAIVT